MIPTAEDFLFDNFEGGAINPNILIEFAKLHVEAALKAASEKAYFRDSNGFVCTTEENKESILNAYPLENIK